MSAVSKFELHFDKADLTFRDGEYITGYMEVILNEEIKFKSVYFGLRGQTLINWESGDSVNNCNVIEDTDDASDVCKEHLFEKHTILIKSGSFLDKDPSLSAGEHIFPFDLKIPRDIPYSFEGRYGKVKYDCIGVIERTPPGLKMSEKLSSSRQSIIILTGLDLNLIPEASYNIEICKQKELGMCCSKGTITIDWLVDKSGFLPNDTIIVEGSVQNDSKQMAAKSAVSLIMIIEYRYRKHRLTDRVRIVSKESSPIMADDVSVWNEVLNVPHCCPSSLDRCKMIEVSYELEVGSSKFKVSIGPYNRPSSSSSSSSSPGAIIPGMGGISNSSCRTIVCNKTIYIGTIPLTNHNHHHPRPAHAQSQYAPMLAPPSPYPMPNQSTAMVAIQPLSLQPTTILIPYYTNLGGGGGGLTNGPLLAPIHNAGRGMAVSSPARLVNNNAYYSLYGGNVSGSSGGGISVGNNKHITIADDSLLSVMEARPPPYAPGIVVENVQTLSLSSPLLPPPSSAATFLPPPLIPSSSPPPSSSSISTSLSSPSIISTTTKTTNSSMAFHSTMITTTTTTTASLVEIPQEQLYHNHLNATTTTAAAAAAATTTTTLLSQIMFDNNGDNTANTIATAATTINTDTTSFGTIATNNTTITNTTTTTANTNDIITTPTVTADITVASNDSTINVDYDDDDGGNDDNDDINKDVNKRKDNKLEYTLEMMDLKLNRSPPDTSGDLISLEPINNLSGNLEFQLIPLNSNLGNSLGHSGASAPGLKTLMK